ncbi:hypothetical protein B9T20_03110 [Wohlfahrtiimonas sp. G9077]|nr:hypothetical protein B9T20_03110 [Wohlfahrtiimonas sp. G9077]
MIMRFFILLFCVLMPIGFAQPITIGNITTLSAPSLNDEARKVQVYVPPSYQDYPSQTYPVIYLLDGESNFHYLTGIVEKLSKAPYPSLPEMIIVGIINTDRTRDLTPSTPSTPVTSHAINGATGGNAAFFDFLEGTLRPLIEQTHRTNGYNILIGHSFGGITALNHLLSNHSMNAYIIHDPSIWWDDAWMLKQFKAARGQDFHNIQLILTQVGKTERRDHLTHHYDAIVAFNDYLQSQPFSRLHYQYAQYEGEDHGSIVIKGNLEGLRTLFAGMQVNIRALNDDPTLVQTHYEDLSAHLGFTLQPSEPYLSSVLSYLKRTGTPKVALAFEKYILTLYPNGNTAQSLAP